MTPEAPPIRILVFARAPRPGHVKTRLIPALGDVGAALLYEEMLAQTLATAWASGVGEVEVWLATRDAYRHVAEITAGRPPRLTVQRVGDLGQRMEDALRRTLEDGALPILIGSDLPPLTGAHLAQAAAALRAGVDAVIAPSEDGGYGLIGASRPLPELFEDVPWSTAAVMPRTRALAVQHGITLQEIERLWDVDEPEDLARLRDRPPYDALLAEMGSGLQGEPQA